MAGMAILATGLYNHSSSSSSSRGDGGGACGTGADATGVDVGATATAAANGPPAATSATMPIKPRAVSALVVEELNAGAAAVPSPTASELGIASHLRGAGGNESMGAAADDGGSSITTASTSAGADGCGGDGLYSGAPSVHLPFPRHVLASFGAASHPRSHGGGKSAVQGTIGGGSGIGLAHGHSPLSGVKRARSGGDASVELEGQGAATKVNGGGVTTESKRLRSSLALPPAPLSTNTLPHPATSASTASSASAAAILSSPAPSEAGRPETSYPYSAGVPLFSPAAAAFGHTTSGNTSSAGRSLVNGKH